MDIRSLVKQILIKKENMRYKKLLAAKQTTYMQWVEEHGKERWKERQEKHQKECRGEQERLLKDVLSSPVHEGSSELCVFVASGGDISQDALEEVSAYFVSNPQAQVVYGDEDVLQDGEQSNPWFKPDWSPDLLESSFYFGSLVVVRREAADRVENHCRTGSGGWNIADFSVEEMQNGCTRYRVTDFEKYEKWVHLCMELASCYDRNSEAVGHISEILFHCEDVSEQDKFLQTSPYLQERRREKLKEFREQWMPVRENGDISVSPLVSVIIPSKDHPDILRTCLEGCRKTMDVPCEIIIVDNGSNEENRRKIELLAAGMNAEDFSVIYQYQPMEFHFSRMCNLGAEAARGAFLLFLNDDVELCEPGCIMEMAMLANQSYTGAVGMKLYYPDSTRIQHAGITNLPMGPVHKLQFSDDNTCYYYNTNRGYRNMEAVTGACLMVKADRFAEAGGFSQELPIAFNDVDLCYTLGEQGYWNVCMNRVHAYHHESLSRGEDESEEKLARLRRECRKLYDRHPDMEGKDRFYSIHLHRDGLDTKVRPAYETAKNRMQNARIEQYDGKQYRQDNCVLLRIESLRNGVLQGYCVVLGDDNACYDKKLLLLGQGGEPLWQIPVDGQYRPDLTENMPDQKNVGLCGFWMKIWEEDFPAGKLAEGRYRIAVGVRNRLTGLRLMNNSNCYFEIERG